MQKNPTNIGEALLFICYNKGMKVIPREVKRITYSTKIRNLKDFKLSKNQESILIGCILGDGYLEPNWSKTNYRLSICHSARQKDYIDWKHSIFKELILNSPYLYKKTMSLKIRTISHSKFTELRNIFYKDNKKIIPKNIISYLDPLTIAIWFMDDGNINRWVKYPSLYTYHINTQSFTVNENKLIVKALKNKYKINAKIHKNNGYPRLYICMDSKMILRKLIEPFVHKSMQYKLG